MTIPVLGFAAYSGSGKTTLLTRLIPVLRERGIRIALVKHAHHTFEMDYPGKDSYELRKAGADTVLIASRKRWARIVEHEDRGDPDLAELLRGLQDTDADMILVEGFKDASIPKIEVHRSSSGSRLLCLKDDHFIAVASDASKSGEVNLPWFGLDAVEDLADFIEQTYFADAETARILAS